MLDELLRRRRPGVDGCRCARRRRRPGAPVLPRPDQAARVVGGPARSRPPARCTTPSGSCSHARGCVVLARPRGRRGQRGRSGAPRRALGPRLGGRDHERHVRAVARVPSHDGAADRRVPARTRAGSRVSVHPPAPGAGRSSPRSSIPRPPPPRSAHAIALQLLERHGVVDPRGGTRRRHARRLRRGVSRAARARRSRAGPTRLVRGGPRGGAVRAAGCRRPPARAPAPRARRARTGRRARGDRSRAALRRRARLARARRREPADSRAPARTWCSSTARASRISNGAAGPC